MAKPWKRCRALIQLVTQINTAYPGRDTTSDGAIGDAEHASRSSDHNPWVIDPVDNVGVVTAQDIDEDLSSEIHSLKDVVVAICKSRDKRVKYIIYEGQITVQGSDLQAWKPYHGTNAHKHHAHISVNKEKKYWDDPSPWAIGSTKTKAVEQAAESKQSAVSSQQPEGSATDTANKPTDPAQPSLVPIQAAAIAVPAVTAAPSEPPAPPAEEGTLTKIGNKLNAAYTGVGATIAGMIAWFTSVPGQIVLYIVAAVVVMGITYMIINWRRQEAKDRRDELDRKEAADREQALKILREQHAQEVQLFTLKAAATDGMTAVVVAPPPPPATELPNSDTEETP